MTDFKKGDRVVYEHTRGGLARHNGRTGTIIADPEWAYDDRFTVNVQWDDGERTPAYPFTHNLELRRTLEALTRDDIDALPISAVIKDSDGDTYERTSDTRWTRTQAEDADEVEPWAHVSVLTLPGTYAPVTLVSTPTVEPEPTPDLAARLAALDAEIREDKDAIVAVQNDVDERRRNLTRKTNLAAQYRAVLADLEARK